MTPTTIDLVLDLAQAPGRLDLGQAHVQPSGRHGVRVRVTMGTLAPATVQDLGTLDYDLRWHAGDQYPADNRATFGFLQDISPDRWGRRLMDRRRSQDIRCARTTAPARLNHWDYLLGVDDRYRLGALRLREPAGGWLRAPGAGNVPPMTSLRTLEAQARVVEEDPDGQSDDDVQMLLAPGSSLGGARPKATVIDPQGRIWIAKFPSLNDRDDVGLWEALTNAMARRCGITVPEMLSHRVGGQHHVAQSLRFDRTPTGGRLHVASAMTLTGHQDGDGAATGAGYLELAQVLVTQGASPQRCLPELWRRIVFNMLVSNADDHLRNHAFLLRPGAGWELAPAYDMNPVPEATQLALNVTESDNAIALELARTVAVHFRVPAVEATATIEQMRAVVRGWRTAATHLGQTRAACDRMAPAFRLADHG